MNEDKWKDTVAHIKDNFEVLHTATEDLGEDSGPGSREVIEFQGPLGKMRLEYITQPLVVDKRTIGSRRIGSDVKIEYKYSDTETVNKLKVFKFDESSGEWSEMEMERGGEMFF